MDRLFSTTALLAVSETLDRPTAWLRDFFFTEPVQFITSEIAFDKLEMSRELAPFVSPRVAGKAVKPRGRTVKTFEPAYVKPLNEVNPDETFVRMAGEQLAGVLTAEKRLALNIIQNLTDQEFKITRREEWMSAQILIGGKVVVAGEDYPEMEIDFGRDPALTLILGENDRWGDANISVLGTLRDWASLVSVKSGGTVTNVVMGAQAAVLFQSDKDVREVLDNRRQAGGQFQLGPVATGGQNLVAVYLGSIGQFDFWQYTQIYTDDAGLVQQMFPEYGVLLVAPDAHYGAMCHGAIKDNTSLAALPRFPKMWNEDNPSITFMMTQSAPLPVSREINATMFVEVGAPAA